MERLENDKLETFVYEADHLPADVIVYWIWNPSLLAKESLTKFSISESQFEYLKDIVLLPQYLLFWKESAATEPSDEHLICKN